MKKIAITGGIASGKSTVSDFVRDRGYAVINADEIGHKMLQVEDVKTEIISKFHVPLKNDEVDRKALGKMVFGDRKKLEILNAILHPRIVSSIVKIFETSKEKEIFVEAAVLFEMGLDKYVDFVIVTDCPDEIRIKRLIERNGFSEAEALSRLHAQMSREEFLKRADYVIDTSKSLKQTFEEVSKLLQLKPWSDKI